MSSVITNYRVLVILSALIALGPLSIDMYLPSLPTIAQALASDEGAVQLTLSSYLLAFSFGQLFYGPLSDSFGRRGLLLSGLGLFFIATVLCALAESIEWLIIFRFLQALGGAACAVLARAIVRDLYEGDAAAKAMSFVMLVMVVAPMLAPLIGGYVLKVSSWEMIFYLLAALGLLLTAVVVVLLQETHPVQHRVPFGFKAYFQRYFQVLSDRSTAGHVLSGAFSFAGMFVYIAGTPFVFINIYGFAPENYGLIFGLNSLGMMVMTYINGRLVGIYSAELVTRIAYISLSFSGVSVLLSAIIFPELYIFLLVSIFIYLTLMGSIAVNSIVLAMKPFPKLAGTASSACGFSRFFFGSIGGAALSVMNDGTALPMAIIIFTCSVLAVFFNLAWSETKN